MREIIVSNEDVNGNDSDFDPIDDFDIQVVSVSWHEKAMENHAMDNHTLLLSFDLIVFSFSYFFFTV